MGTQPCVRHGRSYIACGRALAGLADGDQRAAAVAADRPGALPEQVAAGPAGQAKLPIGHAAAIRRRDHEADPRRRRRAQQAAGVGIDADSATAQLPGEEGDAVLIIEKVRRGEDLGRRGGDRRPQLGQFRRVGDPVRPGPGPGRSGCRRAAATRKRAAASGPRIPRRVGLSPARRAAGRAAGGRSAASPPVRSSPRPSRPCRESRRGGRLHRRRAPPASAAGIAYSRRRSAQRRPTRSSASASAAPDVVTDRRHRPRPRGEPEVSRWPDPQRFERGDLAEQVAEAGPGGGEGLEAAEIDHAADLRRGEHDEGEERQPGRPRGGRQRLAGRARTVPLVDQHRHTPDSRRRRQPGEPGEAVDVDAADRDQGQAGPPAAESPPRRPAARRRAAPATRSRRRGRTAPGLSP